MREARFENRLAHGPADSLLEFAACRNRPVQEYSSLASHAETPVSDAGRHVLRGCAHVGDLEIMDDAGAVHRYGTNDASLHKINDERAEADFNRVSAHAEDDRSISPMRPGNLPRDVFETLRGKNVWQTV